jgi:hypothetical protein
LLLQPGRMLVISNASTASQLLPLSTRTNESLCCLPMMLLPTTLPRPLLPRPAAAEPGPGIPADRGRDRAHHPVDEAVRLVAARRRHAAAGRVSARRGRLGQVRPLPARCHVLGSSLVKLFLVEGGAYLELAPGAGAGKYVRQVLGRGAAPSWFLHQFADAAVVAVLLYWDARFCAATHCLVCGTAEATGQYQAAVPDIADAWPACSWIA